MTQIDPFKVMMRARQAQAAWARLDVARRCVSLGRLRSEIAVNCEWIVESISQETSKPLLDALSGDVMVTLELMRYYEGHAAKLLRTRPLSKPLFFFPGTRFEEYLEPHGVALVFGPSNYPFQLSMVPMITALLTGNAVVLKCSERTPGVAALISQLCTKAELPNGLVQVFHDGPEKSSALIDAKPDIIFFTGSSKNGRLIAERAAKYLIPTILELGGKDASLVFADCNLERAVEGIVYGAFANTGRVCVAVKRVFIEAPIYDAFLSRMKMRISSLTIGADADVDLRPLPGESTSILREQAADAIARGAILHWPQTQAAIGLEPALLTDVPSDARLMTEECFGPVLCAAAFKSEAQAIALANDTSFALSSSVWTRDRSRGRRIASQLTAGSCGVNDVIRVIANPYAAFGGNQLSGYGRYHGPEGIRAFSRVKTVMLAKDRRKREVNWFPFTGRTRRQLTSLLRFRHQPTGLAARLSRMILPLILWLLIGASLQAQARGNSHLTIEVQLGPKAHGELAYLVFDSPSGFPEDRGKAVRHGFLPIHADTAKLRIETDVPLGTYAVSVYQDSNGNHKLDRNLIGIPREPVGASNNPTSHMGPPRFDECSFNVEDTSKTISITLVRR
ncbi:aldehyde dehydrogenase family protein [Acidobacteria bacterium AB60]|nr:aldehyde dehydrogenase family protein [Acidobacteria bacterium AB60]